MAEIKVSAFPTLVDFPETDEKQAKRYSNKTPYGLAQEHSQEDRLRQIDTPLDRALNNKRDNHPQDPPLTSPDDACGILTDEVNRRFAAIQKQLGSEDPQKWNRVWKKYLFQIDNDGAQPTYRNRANQKMRVYYLN
jgi:hypothetical protein